MSERAKGYFQLLLFFVFIAILIRFFPVVLRLAAVAASNIRVFGWVLLIVALGGLSVWVLRRKNPTKR